MKLLLYLESLPSENRKKKNNYFAEQRIVYLLKCAFKISLSLSLLVQNHEKKKRNCRLPTQDVSLETLRIWFPGNLSCWCLHPKSTIEKTQLPGHSTPAEWELSNAWIRGWDSLKFWFCQQTSDTHLSRSA